MPFQTEDRTDVWSIGEIDGVWGLNRDTAVTRGHRRNRERGVGHGVEHSNDLTDRVVTRRNGYLFTTGVHDHTGRIHIVEHDLIRSQQNSDGSDVGVTILVLNDPFECDVGGSALDEQRIVHDLLFHFLMTLITCTIRVSTSARSRKRWGACLRM